MIELSKLRNPPALLRRFWRTDITICIPAYQAETFIGRTLRCATGQTYERVRILISIDRSTDRTADICRQFAALDPRIDIIEHRDRQGWSGNVNALLERADTPFFFLYFHDDLILPQYCELLRRALLAREDAATVHCDVRVFGQTEGLRPGRPYEGTVAKRLLTLWGVSARGMPLRSMVRSESIGADFRLPAEDHQSFAPGHTLILRMMAAGPAVHVAEELYLRWQREGGLIDSWRHLPLEKVLDGWKRSFARTFELIDEKVSDPADRTVIKRAYTLSALTQLSGRCKAEGRPLPDPAVLHPDALAYEPLPDTERFGAEITRRLGRVNSRLIALRAEQCA